MGERIGGRHRPKFIACLSAEWPSARGKDERLGFAELGALEERRMLAIDGNQRAPTPLQRVKRKVEVHLKEREVLDLQ